MKHSSTLLILPLWIATWVSAAGQGSDPWSPMRVFEGKWQGSTAGKPGKGTTEREFRFEFDGKFLFQHDRSVYEPSDPSRKPIVHEDLGYFSYDTEAKKLVWRQFHREGYVNEYALETLSPDGKVLEFVTTRIENLPGFRAKKIYRILSSNEIEETFLLAAPGKGFERYTEADLKRVAK